MDDFWGKSFIADLLRVAGLPGLVLIGWIYTLGTGMPIASDISLWVAVLCISVIVGVIFSQSSVLQQFEKFQFEHSESHVLLVNGLNEVVKLQAQMVNKLVEVQLSVDGKLSLSQIKLILVSIVNSLKWITFSILIKYTGSHSQLISPENLKDVVATTVLSSFGKYAKYNQFFEDVVVTGYLQSALDKVIEQALSAEVQKDTTVANHPQTYIRIIEREFNTCIDALYGYIREKTPVIPRRFALTSSQQAKNAGQGQTKEGSE